MALRFRYIQSVCLSEKLASVPGEAQQGCQGHADGVGQKVEPVARAGFRAIGLQQFDDTTHQDGERDGSDTELGVADVGMAAQVFNPKAGRE